MTRKTVPAGAFKQGCLALIEQVAATKGEIVITKRGKPVARLVPMEEPAVHEQRVLAAWRGAAAQLVTDEALTAPSSELTRWSTLGEDP